MSNPRALIITGSVGIAGLNVRRDVEIVQHLLNRAGGTPRLEEDGVIGRRTIGAIRQFQASVLRYPMPDARVDPHGRTLRSLVARAQPRARAPAAESSWGETLGRAVRGAWSGLEATIESWWRDDRAETPRAARVQAPSTKAAGGQAARGGGVRALGDADFKSAAVRLGTKVDWLLVKALAIKESKGKTGYGPDGRVLVAFEGHKFRRYTRGIYSSTHPKLSYAYTKKTWRPKWVVNNRNHATAWRSLEEAMALDHEAALKSTSYGAFQVLGENHKACGYPRVDDFVNLMKSGLAGQLEAFVLFCKTKPGMVQALEQKDFLQIGIKYNGGSQEGYDTKLRTIYNELKAKK